MEKAIAYIRVSSQRQVEEGGSLDVQTKQVQEYASSKGYQLVRIYREEGESAKTDQRPRLQEMLRQCRDTRLGIRIVIVPKIDRLARSVYDYTNLKLQLGRLGIRLESLGEHIENTPVGRFTETILASVAQFDNEVRAERCKGGMVEAVAQGRWVWKAPAGYRNVRHNGKGTIEPDPALAPVIQSAFEMLAYGHLGAPAVFEYLRSAGLNRPKTSLYRLLQNDVYLGQIRAFGNVFKARPPFVALVDPPTFHKAQSAFQNSNHQRGPRTESSDFPLRGTLVCPCSRRFTAAWSRGEQGGRYPYYRCMHCKGRSYPRAQVERFFATFLRGYRFEPQAWERLRQALVKLEEDHRARSEAEREQTTTRIEKLYRLQDAIALKNASGVIPDELAQRQLQRLSDEIGELSAEMPCPEQNDLGELLDFAGKFLADLESTWNSLTLQLKRDFLRFMFPAGILFDPESGLRTVEKPLAERLRDAVSGHESHLVDPEFLASNSLREWFTSLRTIAYPPRDESS